MIFKGISFQTIVIAFLVALSQVRPINGQD